MTRFIDRIGTADQVRALDQQAIALGLPGFTLMELAARAVAEAAAGRCGGRIGVLVGPGNNGGDGWSAARWLHGWGRSVEVIEVRPPSGGDAATARQVAVASGVAWRPWTGVLPRAELWIDAVFGTGLSRAIDGEPAAALRALSGERVLAIDLPSGLDADTGAARGPVPVCEATLTLGCWKPGLLCGDGLARAGAVSVADLGFGALPGADAFGLGTYGDLETLLQGLPRRASDAHKRTSGALLLLAGSVEMAGAAVLCARGALAAGAGLVTLATPAAALPRLTGLPPEVMWVDRDALPDLRRFDAIAAGPGLGGGAPLPEPLRLALVALWRSGPPAVFDADALPCAVPGGRGVLTPHPGEAGRLLGQASADIQADRFGAARALAGRGVALLKGPRTLVDDGRRVWACPTGGPALATGGTGDVLTGVIGGLLARGCSPVDAARLGAWAHGAAGDALASEGCDEPPARALPDAIARVFAAARARR